MSNIQYQMAVKGFQKNKLGERYGEYRGGGCTIKKKPNWIEVYRLREEANLGLKQWKTPQVRVCLESNVIIQARTNGGFDESSSSGGCEKWLKFRYVGEE